MKAILLAVLLMLLTSSEAGAYRHRMPQPPNVGLRYELHPACDGIPCATTASSEVWVGARPSRFVVSHELGHVFFARVATDADRAYIGQLLGLPGVPWDGATADTCTGRPCPDEIAADAYAACDLRMKPGGRRGAWEVRYGYTPTPRQHLRICNAISFIGYWRLHQSHAESNETR